MMNVMRINCGRRRINEDVEKRIVVGRIKEMWLKIVWRKITGRIEEGGMGR